MNEPIISPWLIYLLGISDSIQTTLGTIGAIALVFGGAATVVNLICFYERAEPVGQAMVRNTRNTLLIVAAIFGPIAILIPEREWIVATALASQTTEPNIERIMEAGGDLRETLKQDFIEIIQSIDD